VRLGAALVQRGDEKALDVAFPGVVATTGPE
jgi:hypothetical protein